jgi:Zn-dependent protease with chaperone function
VTYLLYGVTLAFTWFLALNIVLSLGVASSVAPISDRITGLPSALRANTLLALRLLPAIGSLAFVASVFVPSFVALEPRAFDEAFGLTTTAFAVASCVLVAAGAWRGSSALRQAADRSRRWRAHARPVALDGAVPALCLDGGAPAMTLVGVLRPTLLVTQPLLDALSADELHATLAHERAHSGAFDNFKRLAMRAVPDALSVLPASRRLEREWAQAAEYAADARAARDERTRLSLASALVKVARRTPPSPLAFSALASPLVGGEGIASRIARLLEPPERGLSPRARLTAALAIAGATAAILLGYHPLLAGVHQVSEVVVHVLP